MSVLWGMPYLFIKVAVEGGLSPAFLSWGRLALAAVVVVAIAARAGLLGSVRGRWRWLVLYALAEMVVPFPLIAAGEEHVSSSLTAILIAAVPLVVAVLALRFDPAERVSGRRLVGLLVGFGGVVVLMGLDVAGRPAEMLGAGAILLGACGYTIAAMILKARLSDLDPRATIAASLCVAALALTPLALLTPPVAAPSPEALVSVVVLGLFCTAAALVLFVALVNEVGPGRATVITYVAPLVAVALGVAVLGERPGAGAVAGLLLILAGSWLATAGRREGARGALPSGRNLS